MQTTGDDNQSLTRPESQRRIIKDMILSGCSIGHNYFSGPRISPFEGKIPFNLT